MRHRSPGSGRVCRPLACADRDGHRSGAGPVLPPIAFAVLRHGGRERGSSETDTEVQGYVLDLFNVLKALDRTPGNPAATARVCISRADASQSVGTIVWAEWRG